MAYEVYGYCKRHKELTDWEESQYFKFCPECGNKVKIIGHCLDCGREGTESIIHKHKCKCKKHNEFYKRYGGLFGDFECPKCRKEKLQRQIKSF